MRTSMKKIAEANNHRLLISMNTFILNQVIEKY